MAIESTNPDNSSMHSDQNQTQQFEGELKGMISELSSNLSRLRQDPSSSHPDADADDNGVCIITLAGTNMGATLKTDLGEQRHPRQTINPSEDEDGDDSEETGGPLVNSNFQAVNNSIMLGASYSSNDPGVKIEISDAIPDHYRRRHGYEVHDLQEEGK